MFSEASRSGLPILYQDEHLAIVDKPSGLAVHRGECRDRVTAMSVVRDQLDKYVYPAHRLDRGTSGTLVFALSKDAASNLSNTFGTHAVEKKYWAFARGIIAEAEFTIDYPVPRGPKAERVPAVTAFRRIASGDHWTCVEATPRTGRYHQIRRHLRHILHPILGDTTYGSGVVFKHFRDVRGLRRLALHAHSIRFTHPISGETVHARAPLPVELEAVFGPLPPT